MIDWTRWLATVAGLGLAGAGFGVYLGHATVGDIDPFYSTDPRGTESYAALVPAASRTGPPAYVPEPSDPDAGYGTGCVACELREAAYSAARDGYADGYTASAWGGDEAPTLQSAVYEIEPEPAPQPDPELREAMQRVELYAYYPVRPTMREVHDGAIAAVIEEEVESEPAPRTLAEDEAYYGY